MKRLLPRLVVIWLAMIMIIGAGVLFGRLVHEPTTLQKLGFDVCDGDPCFRGLKPGDDWSKVQELLPNQTLYQPIDVRWIFEETDGVTTTEKLILTHSEKNNTIADITMGDGYIASVPFTAADVIAEYGPPCRVHLDYLEYIPTSMDLIYPTLKVRTVFRLKWTSKLWEFRLFENDSDKDPCSQETTEFYGPWHGFHFAEYYRQQNLRDMGVETP